MANNYEFISKNNPEVKAAYFELLSILADVQNEVRKHFTFSYEVVGSYKRNMTTYQPKTNIGYDFDFNIFPNADVDEYDPKRIKNILMDAFKKVIKHTPYTKVEDSTRVITIKVQDRVNSRVMRSADFAVIWDYWEDGCFYQYYIHNDKKGNYTWQEQSHGSYWFQEKFDWIRKKNLKQELKDMYLYLKNKNEDPNCHSRSILISAVSNIYNEYGYEQ